MGRGRQSGVRGAGVRALLATALAAIVSTLLFSASASAQTEQLARVASLTGQVSVLKDSIPWVLNPGDSIRPRQVVVTGADGQALFQLPDGSTFQVYPNSRLVFRESPANWKDLIDLYIGRVRISIQKLGGQPNHNRIHTPTAVISVRGTVFDVAVEDDDATTLVLVEEGQVAVEHSLLPRGQAKLLNSGEWVRVYRNQPLAAKNVDRGSLLQATFRTASDVMTGVMLRTSRGGIGGGRGGSIPSSSGGSVPLPGDASSTAPTPPPPAPPPPPPPPPGSN